MLDRRARAPGCEGLADYQTPDVLEVLSPAFVGLGGEAGSVRA